MASSPDGAEHPRPHVPLPDWGSTDGLHVYVGHDVRVVATIDGTEQVLFGRVARVAASQAFLDLRVAGRKEDGGGIRRIPEWCIEHVRDVQRGEVNR